MMRLPLTAVVLSNIGVGGSPALSAGAAGDGAPVLTGVTPSRVPITGGVPLVIRLEPGSAVAGSTAARPLKCKLSPACSVGHYDSYEHHCSSVVWATFNTKTAALLVDAHQLNATHVTCTPPPVVVAGPVYLSMSAGCTVGGGNCSNYLKVTYFAPVDVAVGRRPYLTESQGALLLRTDPSLRAVPLAVTASLAFAKRKWSWQLTPRNGTSVLWFGLSGLPAVINNDICVLVVMGTGKIRQCRRLMRTTAPAPGSAVQPVQIDHHTQTFRIAGKPFIGTGWYVGQQPSPNITRFLNVLRPHAELGANMFVAEDTYNMAQADKLKLLDGAHAMGIKIIWSLRGKKGHKFPDGLGFGAGVFSNISEAEAMLANAQWERNLLGNVSAVMDHPALLGWYLCDDCCPLAANLNEISLQARVYNLIKQRDPYHAISGAAQCSNSWLWNDVPSSEAPDPPVESATIPFSAQPQLQLGMDFFCQENYKQLLRQHAGDGTWKGGEQTDGAMRNGIPFEVLVNLPGLWQKTGFQGHPAAPRFKRSTMWLGLLSAGMVNSLGFVLQTYSNDQYGFQSSWLSSEGWPAGGWLLTIQSNVWAAQMRALAPSFTQPFGTVAHPGVSVRSATCLEGGGGGAGVDNSTPIRARAWRERCESAGGAEEEELCVHIIVVNIREEAFVNFKLSVTLPPPWNSRTLNATRLFDAAYNRTIAGPHGVLSDIIAPGETSIYEVGCSRRWKWGLAPLWNTTDGPEPLPGGYYPGEAYSACANRRVVCQLGFTQAVGSHPASLARCGAENGPF